MEAYRFFRLSAAPFEGPPNPRFFHPAPSHAEALATLQYAAHAGKTCTLVLGESGSGKTLLGRMLIQNCAGHATLLWVHGLGQPDGQTDVTISRPGQRRRPEALDHKHTAETTLANWIRTGLPSCGPTIIIIDDADGLRPHSWEDVLALVTREIRTPAPVCLVLLGLPHLLDVLAAAPLVRLQRRVFRTCQLARLGSRDVVAYVRHRMNVAGADGSEIFTSASLELIHRFSDGNPALINQLCDNALLDAFSDERRRIDAHDVVTTIHSITGYVHKQRCLPDSSAAPRQVQTLHSAAPDTSRIRARLQEIVAAANIADADDPAAALRELFKPPAEATAYDTAAAPHMSQTDADSVAPFAPESDELIVEGPLDGDAPIAPAVAVAPAVALAPADEPRRDLAYVPLEDRLRMLESRLSEALSRVRAARPR